MSEKYTPIKAPKGGVKVKGKLYKGGQFIPRQVVETLSKKQIQMVSEGKEVKENENIDLGEVSESLSRFVVAETILLVFYWIGSLFYEFNLFIFMIISISALLGTLILPIFKSTILDVKSGITWFTDGVVNFLSVGLTLVFAFSFF